jgi:hypothetical protein
MEQRRRSDRPGWWIKYAAISGAVLTTAGIIAMATASLLDPHINKLIDDKEKPIYEAIKFNEACHRAMMSDEQIKKAREIYNFDKESRGVPTSARQQK